MDNCLINQGRPAKVSPAPHDLVKRSWCSLEIAATNRFSTESQNHKPVFTTHKFQHCKCNCLAAAKVFSEEPWKLNIQNIENNRSFPGHQNFIWSQMTDKFARKPVLILKREKGSRIVESENNELQIGFWGADNSGRPRPTGRSWGRRGSDGESNQFAIFRSRPTPPAARGRCSEKNAVCKKIFSKLICSNVNVLSPHCDNACVWHYLTPVYSG